MKILNYFVSDEGDADDAFGDHPYSHLSHKDLEVVTVLDGIEIVNDLRYDDDDANCFVDNFGKGYCYDLI